MMFLRSNIMNVGIIILLFFISCKHPYQQKITVETDSHIENFFIHANKKIIRNEEVKIDSLISEVSMPFFRDSTGIRFLIDSYSNFVDSFIYPIDGDVVSIAYNCFVFDDVENIYDSYLTDTIRFKIGYSKQMRGLNYGIKLLQIGDKAKIIIPSYLGFGMSGYGKSVPPYSTLLLNVKLLNIEK